jgi:RNA polymerase sigma-70 factor (ECF subfamily)
MTDSVLDVSAVFREHSGLVERALRRCGVPERDIQDAQQEVFLVVHRKLHEFENRALLSTWLYRIAMHVASEHRRRACNRHELLSHEGGDPQQQDPQQQDRTHPCAAHENPLHVLEQRDLLALALRALEHLDPDKREVFVLYELMELSMTEVAARARIPLKTAFSRLYAGRRQVLAELRKAGVVGSGVPMFLPLRLGLGRKLLENSSAKATVMWPLHASVAALAAICMLMPATGLPATSGRSDARATAALPRLGAVTTAATTQAPGTSRAERGKAPPWVPSLIRSAAAVTARTATAAPTSHKAGAPSAPPRPTLPQSSAAKPLTDLDDFELVHASAVDLRPVLESPLAPERPRGPHRAARLHVSGPQEAATGIEEVLSHEPANTGAL